MHYSRGLKASSVFTNTIQRRWNGEDAKARRGLVHVGRRKENSYIKGRFPLVAFGNGPHRAIYIRPSHIVSHLCCYMLD